MAKLAERLSGNASGEFFVDATCIDCATCRELLPSVYEQGDGFSYVRKQPETPPERHRALMALVACPTGSIGTVPTRSAAAAVASFPEPLGDDVFFCGFTSEKSFGAWSYFVRRPEGNLLVDSPRAAAPLRKRIGEMGGISTMLLTHRDDVADHEQIRAAFECERVIHRRDAAALGGAAERLLVLLGGADPLHGAAPRVRLHDGPAGARRTLPRRFPGGHAPRGGALRRLDEGAALIGATSGGRGERKRSS